ncbi:MAG: hypothetical protein A2Y25_05045 [Candidatus Melainabacteria bacterium GWF2_37_15]|nr:MAG: hypothetical protein A2Y25_05045 [Candidatus Melainabacteria bacterium GWF2_37_15]
MKFKGKHAKIEIYLERQRVFKTYKDPMYADNEYFALCFLADQNIMDLKPRKESLFTISLDFIQDAKSLDFTCKMDTERFVGLLTLYLRNLHRSSLHNFGKYITHEDIFPDNILICEKLGTLYFIDWGLSKKRESPYPDIASCALGVFNNEAGLYRLFLEQYFGDISKINFNLIDKYINDIYNECKSIRLENNFEINSLDERFEKAKHIIQSI